MKLKLYIILSLSLCSSCFADRFIQPVKYDHQEEILVNGGSMLLSNKINSVLMYQVSETTCNRRANFYFSLSNDTSENINFYFDNLQVTDQWGRQVRVIPKKELIENKRITKNWNEFASALCTGLAAVNAQNAGKINYQSNTNTNYNSNFRANVNNSLVRGSASGHSSSTTSGTIQCEALRQQAMRQVGEDAYCRDQAIQNDFEYWEYGLENFYFDSMTVFPGNIYSANFQIDIDKNIEKDLQYLLFTYKIGDDEHTFCFDCGVVKSRRG